MENPKRHFKKFGFTIVLVLFLLFTMTNNSSDTKKNVVFNLVQPAFIQDVHAATSEIGQKLDNEAGISAYYHSSVAIDLNKVRSLFNIIEIDDPNYIIGSINIPPYDSGYTPHVYVHKSGWILAYYFNDAPESKMVDGRARTINNTILKTAVVLVANAANISFTDVTYYDFRYPNANKILMVAKDESSGTSFSIKMPSSFTYFEYGWSYMCPLGGNAWLSLDGVINLLSSTIYYGSYESYGKINSSVMTADVTHTISAHCYWDRAYTVFIITYRDN